MMIRVLIKSSTIILTNITNNITCQKKKRIYRLLFYVYAKAIDRNFEF